MSKRTRIATIAVISVGFIAGVVGNLFLASMNRSTAADRKASGNEVATDTPSEDEAAAIKKLAKDRVDVAQKAYRVAVQLVREGKSGSKLEDVYTWSVRLLKAQRDVSSKRDDQLSALNDHLKRMQDHAKVARALWQAGGVGASPLDVPAADFYLREAELWLAQAKAAPK